MSTPVRERRKPDKAILRQVHAALILKGHSYKSWAEDNNFQPRTVTQAVYRYAGTKDQPRGRLTWKILCELSAATGIELVPGSLQEAA